MRIDSRTIILFSRAALFAAAACIASGPAAAAQNPELVAHVGEGDDGSIQTKALSIANLDIDVRITGDTAHTIVTAKFLNSGPQILEGDFVFDLPPNSVVTGYALDVNGRMLDGVLVGKRKATLTFEARERRGIDPGLAEVNRAGAFTTRVYPVLQQGRTVRLEFVTPLDPGKPFTIPLMTAAPVGAVTLHVVTDAAHAPALQAPDGFDLKWTRSGEGYEARATSANRALAGALTLGPVAPAKPLWLAQHKSGDTFFEINDIAPAAGDAESRPAHVRIYWDSSLSRRDADLASEIDLVGRYIDTVHPASVDLVFFSTDAPLVRSFASPTAAAVTAVLKTTDYQGGSSMAPLRKAGLPAADACLLFSDGNMTVDSYRAERLPCVLSAVSSAADANRAFLTALAQRSGGDYVDLSDEKVDGALAQLLHRAPRVVSVSDAGGHDIDYALLPSNGDRIRIVGKLPEAGGITVKLTGAMQNTRSYAPDRAASVWDDALAALWAARDIDEMNATDRPDADEMLLVSRRYSVASAASSFVVFENIQDYLEADAEPPPSFDKAAFMQFVQMKHALDEGAARATATRLDTIAAMWTEEKAWWNIKFKPGPRKPPPPKQALPNVLSAPDAVPVPAPSPPPPPPGDTNGVGRFIGGSSVESVVVTADRAPQQGFASSSPVTVVGGQPRSNSGPQIEVTIAPWNPDRPYIKALTAAKPESFWTVYRDQEKEFGTLPAFYLDVAEFLFRHDKTADAIKVALNALELPAANTTTMTILADRLMRYGDETRALWLYDRILYLEPDRPQPRRNLALALVTRAQHTGALAESADDQRRDLSRALDLLNEVVTHVWAGAYDGIEIISLMEANHIVPRLKKLGVTKNPLDKRLIALLDVDLRVVLEWNTDETDMDLWVDEPTGERAIYNNPRTKIGGRLSNDMTNGYGPEEYLLHRAPDGTYTVRVNVYAADRINPNGATTVRAHIFRNYGRAGEQEQALELELKKNAAGTQIVGTIKVKGNK